MTRCLRERELYAVDDGILPGGLRAHLNACPVCATKRARIEAMRAVAREATRPRVSDWDAVDRRVLAAVRARSRAGGRATLRFGALAWSAAAALLLILGALAMGRGALFGRDAGRAPRIASPDRPATPFRSDLVELEASVVRRMGNGCPRAGSRVEEGTAIETSEGGDALVSIGEDVSVEARGGAAMTVVSLDAFHPAVRLDSGAFFISVKDAPLAPELVVLSQAGEFALLSGSAEVLFLDGAFEVLASFGPVVVEADGVQHTLGRGRGLLRARDGGAAWEAEALAFDAATAVATTPAAAEETLSGPARGTLPKAVVSELLRANAQKMRDCYEYALKRYSKLEELPVTARFTVTTSGSVSRLRLEGVSDWPVLESCLTGVFEEMSFPRPRGGEVDLIAPLRLEPRN